MYTFGPLIAKNSRSGRLLGGAPITVTTLDGVTLTTTPAPLVTNHEGYLPTFTADTDQRVILARPRGGDPLPLYAHEGIQDAAEAADTINTGRLSEDALDDTYIPQAGAGAAGLAVLAAALPADAREALNITIDTSVGTRVYIGGVMVYGDTGWRQIPTVDPLSTVTIRRINSTVELVSSNSTFAGSGTVSGAITIPTGFRPGVVRRLLYGEASSAPSQKAYMVRQTGQSDLYTKTPDTGLYISQNWLTSQTWPTTLPGSAA